MTITREQMIETIKECLTDSTLVPMDGKMLWAILAELTKQSGNGKMKSAEEWVAESCAEQWDCDETGIEWVKAIQADALNAKQDGWQPIETAPRDGTRVLVALQEHQDIGILHFDNSWQDDGENYVPDNWITGWMPLPQPPKEQTR